MTPTPPKMSTRPILVPGTVPPVAHKEYLRAARAVLAQMPGAGAAEVEREAMRVVMGEEVKELGLFEL
jgi:hypothetical protein